MFEILTIESLLLLFILGSFAGLMAGLLGVGGGLIIVPALIFYFEYLGFPSEHLTQMAVATSLATIIFTSISSVRSHHKHGAVEWRLVANISVGIVGGAAIGAWFAFQLEGLLLQLLFGVFAIAIALQMFFQLKPVSKTLPSFSVQATGGAGIAIVSAMFGIGGGSLSVPMLSFFGLDMKRAVAVSAACGLPIAIFSVLSFLYLSLGIESLPIGSFGFVYLPAFFSISILSVIAAHFGAKLAHKLPASRLKQIFACFLFIVGLRLIVSAL